jgi:putative ABC transport system substrate-binding protein
VDLRVVRVGAASEIDAAFATLVNQRIGALVIFPQAIFIGRADQIAKLAARHMIPAISGGGAHVEAGGLVSYGADIADVYRKLGIYAGRILKGAKPQDLPIELPTKFNLLVNLKTAKALGITIPQSILLRADEVIE